MVDTPENGARPAAKRPATEEEARALASPLRLRILRLCLDRALTNKDIAQRLDANPATTLHHVRKLVATGFLAPQPERRGSRGAREVPYLATGKSWTLSVGEAESGAGNTAMVQAFLEEMQLIDPGQAWLARLGLRLTDAELEELLARIRPILDELSDRPASPHGRPLSMLIALIPDVSRD